LLAADEKDALDKCKAAAGLITHHNTEKSAAPADQDDPERECPELDTIIPDKATAPYNMQKVIKAIVDDGIFFETNGALRHQCYHRFCPL